MGPHNWTKNDSGQFQCLSIPSTDQAHEEFEGKRRTQLIIKL